MLDAIEVALEAQPVRIRLLRAASFPGPDRTSGPGRQQPRELGLALLASPQRPADKGACLRMSARNRLLDLGKGLPGHESRVSAGCDKFSVMHETADDLAELDRVLDRSHAGAGSHLREIFHDDRRLTAEALVELLPGVQILSLATVTADCRPIAGAVDGLFYRGHFYFGSSPDSVRFRHLRARPAVSATHLRGEELAVVVHGTAHEIDPNAAEHAGFKEYVQTTYDDWSEWGSESPYARVDADKMFAAWLPGADLS